MQKWYTTTFILAWFLMAVSSLNILIVVLRPGFAIRHDTVSSYIAGHTDGARMLVVCLTMTTWSVLATHLLEYQIQEACGQDTEWAASLVVIASLSITLTLCVPGGKFYVAAVRAVTDVSPMTCSEDFSEDPTILVTEQAHENEDTVNEDQVAVHEVGPPKHSSNETNSDCPAIELQCYSARHSQPSGLGLQDNVMDDSESANQLKMLSSHQIGSEKLTQQVRLLLPPPDGFFADGHSLEKADSITGRAYRYQAPYGCADACLRVWRLNLSHVSIVGRARHHHEGCWSEDG